MKGRLVSRISLLIMLAVNKGGLDSVGGVPRAAVSLRRHSMQEKIPRDQ
jgi:hypothetical protein